MENSVTKILDIQNNNYPYLFIDKLFEVEPLKFGIGKKCFTKNEWFYNISNDFLVPKFIQIEALVQMLVITIQYESKYKSEILNDVKFKNIEFFENIKPGDCIIIKSKVLTIKRGLITGFSEGFLNDRMVCRMECIMAIVNELTRFTPN
jgi:3-hydroxymyristoyl/3-hydroxydecanoyl-(acyl carrier protein) dehydratase